MTVETQPDNTRIGMVNGRVSDRGFYGTLESVELLSLF
jgi:hypothetical protein